MAAVTALFKPGDQVTLRAIGADPILLQLNPHVLVSRLSDEGYWVRPSWTGGRSPEFGPIQHDRLLPGWTEGGRWR